MNRDEIRQFLNEQAVSLFDDIVNSRVLGANNHIRMIGEMIILTAQDLTETKESFLKKINEISQFFIATRGQQSRAIYNAIRYYLKGVDKVEKSQENTFREEIIQHIDSYRIDADKNMNTLAAYGNHIAENMDTIMIFDYSSTVDKFVAGLGRRRVIYIPESRALDGGRPFVNTALNAGHEVHFIPDTTMLVALKECQGAFIGAETVYPDGTVFNTVGSDILAILCQQIRVPLYVLTPMIKVDVRPVYGYIRLSPIPFDYGPRLASLWEQDMKEQVDFRGIKLITIEPKYVRAFITEKGIIPPYGFFSEAMKYADFLEKR